MRLYIENRLQPVVSLFDISGPAAPIQTIKSLHHFINDK
jgi:hypothetical protein